MAAPYRLPEGPASYSPDRGFSSRQGFGGHHMPPPMRVSSRPSSPSPFYPANSNPSYPRPSVDHSFSRGSSPSQPNQRRRLPPKSPPPSLNLHPVNGARPPYPAAPYSPGHPLGDAPRNPYDRPPQLPPLAISPRWDSLSNIAGYLGQPSPSLPRTPTTPATFSDAESAILPPPSIRNASLQHDSWQTVSSISLTDPRPNPAKNVDGAATRLVQQPQGLGVFTAAAPTSPSTYDQQPTTPTSYAPSLSPKPSPPQKSARRGLVGGTRATDDSMAVENFSRPRKASIKQPTPPASIIESAQSSQSPQTIHSSLASPSSTATTPSIHQQPPARPIYFEDAGKPRSVVVDARGPDISSGPSASEGWRGRGLSLSSSNSLSTVSSAARSSPVDHRDHTNLVPKPTITTTSAPPLPPAPNYSNINTKSFSLDAPPSTPSTPPWMLNEESRSSYRSQNTVSTAQATFLTERSSVMSKNTSITSLYAGVDEPSVEDVMGMYEKGFADDTDEEDFEESRPATAKSEFARHTPPVLLSPDTKPLPRPPLPTSAAPSALLFEPVTRDSTSIFGVRAFASSVPDDIGLGRVPVPPRVQDNRDSAKSMGENSPGVAVADVPKDDTNKTIRAEPEEDPSARDRYGFRKQNQYITREQYDSWDATYKPYLERRKKKWVAFMKDNGLSVDNPMRFPLPSTKTKRFVRKGIPPEWRGAAWFYYAHGPAIMGRHAGVYADLVRQKARDGDIDIIERDLHRTFPDNVRFRPSGAASSTAVGSSNSTLDGQDQSSEFSGETATEPEIISSLRRVLHAFSIYNPRIGYCQSLNFLAGLLLLFVPSEEQAFWLLNIITRLFLPGTHETNLEGSRVDLGVLMETLFESMPQVWQKITDQGGDVATGSRPGTARPGKKTWSRRRDAGSLSALAANQTDDQLPPITLCMTAWFMSCFIGTLPIETTLRVWDIFFYEGSKTLFRVALSVFKLGESEIMGVTDPMEMFSVVQSIPRRMIDANAVVEACFRRRNGFGHVSQQSIDSQRELRRQKAELDRQRQAARDAGEEIPVADVEEKRTANIFARRKRRGTDARSAQAL